MAVIGKDGSIPMSLMLVIFISISKNHFWKPNTFIHLIHTMCIDRPF